MSLALYKIDAEMDAIFRASAENEGELTDEQSARVDELEIEWPVKVEHVGMHVRNLKATAKAYKDEAARMAAKGKAAENDADYWTEYLYASLMKPNNPKVVKGKFLTVALQNSPRKLAIEDETAIPKAYLVQPDPVIDKAGIKAALESGGIVPGASLFQGQHIRIR